MGKQFTHCEKCRQIADTNRIVIDIKNNEGYYICESCYDDFMEISEMLSDLYTMGLRKFITGSSEKAQSDRKG